MREQVNEAVLLIRDADEKFLNYDYEGAKKLYVQAADLFVSAAAKSEGPYEKNAANYSAAVLYFDGEQYQKSANMIGGLNQHFLKEYTNEISELYQKARDRQSHYPGSIIQEVQKYESKIMNKESSDKNVKLNCERLLDLLKSHRYIYPPLKVAKLRYEILNKLQRTEEAEMMKKDVEKLTKSESLQQAAESFMTTLFSV
jgi:hypothetical protein